MLYVSRFVGTLKIGVVDTDDNTEQVITLHELEDYILNLGVHVEGVTVTVSNNGRRFVEKFEVYQSAEDMSRSQAKLKMLKGIDVKVYNDQIVAVNMKKELVPPGTTLRLSDYAPSCSKYIFRSMSFNWGANVIATVILDDKCAINNNTFKGFFMCGLAVDIREVTSWKTVEAVAKELIGSSIFFDGIDKGFIIATERQLDFMKAILMMNKAPHIKKGLMSIKQLVTDYAFANQVAAQKYSKEFITLSRTSLVYDEHTHIQWIQDSLDFIRWLSKPDNMHRLSSQDYIDLRSYRYPETFKAVREMSTVNKKAIQRFENYIMFFTPSEEMKQVYMQFIKRSGMWLVSEAKKHNLV